MYVGHAFLAFAIGSLGARGLGRPRRQALLVGAVAAGFAMVPDVDTVYTVYVVLEAGPTRLFPTPTHVWTDDSWIVHRSLTHSFLIGSVTVGLVWLTGTAMRSRERWYRVLASIAAAGGTAAIIALGSTVDGAPGGAIMLIYLGGAFGLTWLAGRRNLPTGLTAGAAAVGLLTHPFGDVFMGRPPVFLYPLRTEPQVGQLALAADPTVNLVGLFVLELLLAWLALWVVARLADRRLVDDVKPRAALAVGFGGMALFIRPPTLEVAYHFAIGTISTGLVIGFLPSIARERGSDRASAFSAAVTGLAAVALAALGYLVGYLVVSS